MTETKVTVRLESEEKELLFWYWRNQGTNASDRIRDLISGDLQKARQAVVKADASDNKYVRQLKRKVR